MSASADKSSKQIIRDAMKALLPIDAIENKDRPLLPAGVVSGIRVYVKSDSINKFATLVADGSPFSEPDKDALNTLIAALIEAANKEHGVTDFRPMTHKEIRDHMVEQYRQRAALAELMKALPAGSADEDDKSNYGPTLH